MILPTQQDIDHRHEEDHHDQGESYQQPKWSWEEWEWLSVYGVKGVSHLGPKFHFLVRNRSNTILGLDLVLV